jgi:hypothetical protein
MEMSDCRMSMCASGSEECDMKKSAKIKKLRTGVTRGALAADLKRKRKPRGRPFTKGNTAGLAFRYPKGVSGNPGGCPRYSEVSKAARALLALPIPGDPEKRLFAEGIAETLAWQALAGDRGAASELVDRAEGKPRQAVELEQRDPLAELLQEMRKESARCGPPEGMPEAALPPAVEETAAEEPPVQ